MPVGDTITPYLSDFQSRRYEGKPHNLEQLNLRSSLFSETGASRSKDRKERMQNASAVSAIGDCLIIRLDPDF